jgi:uncharacterized pyridoxamine 5'-phosphate oxidase family protein
MYQNEATNKFSREIALENVILQINTNQEKSHYFEISTEQNIYFCGCKRTRSRVKIKKRSYLDFDFVFFFSLRNMTFHIHHNMQEMLIHKFVKHY